MTKQQAIENANKLSISQGKHMQVVCCDRTGAHMVFSAGNNVSIGYRSVFNTEAENEAATE